MSEIEKLYENAGVGYLMYVVDTFPPVEYPQINFTAEKQLGLIKWLAFRDYIAIMAYISGEYHSEHDKYNADENSLEGCLAKLINSLWQDLSETEKAEIKEILK